jgi:hypothetical protein
VTRRSHQTAAEDVELMIPLEKVCFIIFKAREFDVKEAANETDPGSNPADDKDVSVLEDYGDDPVLEELTSLISDLSVDEQVDLVTLMWLGRGDHTADDWSTLRTEASGEHNERTAGYLCGTPLLADHLFNGLGELGLSCAEYEREHL